VAARVKQRMQQVAAGAGPHRRPILLFPEGTTTNGRYLLRFRTGGFIAGVPVQPIILRYGKVRDRPRSSLLVLGCTACIRQVAG
jgi:lysophosphatidylcholine acyltransferase / lyso-PAF acetyltransferase